jgi:tryptophan 2,3-dioxygenase
MAKTDVTYTSYLDLDRVLAAQHPASGLHDEMMFIIVHQASELWLKLCLHELTEARRHIAADNLRPAFKMLSRVARAQGQLIQSWDVLSTMTPHDYSTIRPHLGNSSGFQSWQYRMMEFMLGGRNPDMISLHERLPEAAAMLAREAASPSIYDETVRLLARRGFAIDEAVLDRDIETPYAHSQSVEDAWAEIYRAPREHWDLYELAEKLVDLEYHFQRWRFGHLKTVERIIGFKTGTGGTPGVPYLEGVLKAAFFPELLSVRTAL